MNYYEKDMKYVKILWSYGALCLITIPFLKVSKTDVLASEFLKMPSSK